MNKGKTFGLVVALIAIVLIFSVEYSRRQDLYWYDVGKDHRVDLRGAGTLSFALEIDADGLTLPRTQIKAHTALVRMSVDSTVGGHWFEPRLTLSANDQTIHQYVERGATGKRYFLLPETWLSPGATISLDGMHLTWPVQAGELILFNDAPPAKSKVLVLAPHPDDAEIAAFGLYSTHASYVVTITAGDYVDGRYAQLSSDQDRQREMRGVVRVWDSLTIPLMAGVDSARVANLGYGNGSLDALRRANGAPRSEQRAPFARFRQGELLASAGSEPEPSWRSLVVDLASLVDAVRPDVVVAPHPTLDAAPDHQLTTLALLQALEQIDERQSVLYLYTNHHVLSEHYPFGPSDSHVTIPPWHDEKLRIPSIYSHPLSPSDQMSKLFALESMHDLRAAPLRFYGGVTERVLARLSHSIGQVIADPVGTYSYFRRAVRPNELFFVYAPNERALLKTDATRI